MVARLDGGNLGSGSEMERGKRRGARERAGCGVRIDVTGSFIL